MPKKKVIEEVSNNNTENISNSSEVDLSAKQIDNLDIFLIVLDIFSRYAWVKHIPNKKIETVSKAFREIFNESGRKPDKLWTDEGAEFQFLIDKGKSEEKPVTKDNKEYKCSFCGRYFKNQSGLTQHINRTHASTSTEPPPSSSIHKLTGIELYHSYGKNKASIAERFIKTFKDMIGRWITDNPGKNYLSAIPSLVKVYNETPHRKFKDKYSPIEASQKSNEKTILEQFYDVSKPKNKSKDTITETKELLPGDKVRIQRRKKDGLEKGWTPNWTKEIFIIREIKNTEPITYYLKDNKDHHIKGVFYREELQKTVYPLEDWMGYNKPRSKENARLGMEVVQAEATRQREKKQRQRDRKKATATSGKGIQNSSKLVKELSPNKSLTNFDLEQVCSKLRNWKGVYSRNNLPKSCRQKECGILNLDDKEGPGTHWTCWYKNKKNKYYFDSYGIQPPTELIKYLKSPIQYSSDQIQDYNTVICGHLCVFVLEKLSEGYDLYPIVSYLNSLKENYNPSKS